MTALASRFTISGDVRCFAGEALTVEIAFDTAGSLVDLTGREWAWTVYRANDREPLFSAAGEVVSVGDDHFVRFAIDGDTTDELFARNRIGLRHEMAEVTAGGRDVWVEGQFSIARSAAAVSPAPVNATAGSVTRFVFDYQTRRVAISPRGAPGMPIWQALGLTQAEYEASVRKPAVDAAALVDSAITELGEFTSQRSADIDDAIDKADADVAAFTAAARTDVDAKIGEAEIARRNAETEAGYAATQGDYARAQALAIGDVGASVATARIARDQAVEAMASLKEVVPQIIGRTSDPVTGASASQNTFVWLSPVVAAGNLTQVKLFALAAGSVTIARYTIAGSTIARAGVSSAIPVTAGLNTLTINDFPVAVGDVLAIAPSAAGVLCYSVSTPADGAGWAATNGAVPPGASVGATQTSQRIEVGFVVSSYQQVVNIPSFKAVRATADAAKGIADATKVTSDANAQAVAQLMQTSVTQRIGRPIDPVTGPGVSFTTFFWLTPISTSGKLTEVRLFALASGSVTIGRYTSSGSTVTRVAASAPMEVTPGLNVLSLADFSVAAGELLALAPSAAGLFSYLSATPADGAGWAQMSGLIPAGGTLSAAQTGQRLEVGFAISTTSQAVTAAAVKAASDGASTALAKANTHDNAVSALIATVPQVIGRPASAVLVTGTGITSGIFSAADPVQTTGTLASIDLFALAPGNITIYRYTLSGATMTLVASKTVAVTQTGAVNVAMAMPVVAGEYLAIAGSGVVAYSRGSQDSGYYFVAANGSYSTQVNYLFQLRYNLTATKQTVTAETFKTTNEKVADLAGKVADISVSSPLKGKRVAVIGDSYSASYAGVWQQAFFSRTGAIWQTQDARPGRTWASALEGYGASSPLSSIDGLTAYSRATPTTGQRPIANSTLANFNNFGVAPPVDGASLATWLTQIDLLIIALGTNDARVSELGNLPIGALTDAYTAGTLHASINFVLDAILTARPGLAIMGVTNCYCPSSGGVASSRAVADALLSAFDARGLPILSGYRMGVSSKTAATLLRDGIHPTDAMFANRFAPMVARAAEGVGLSV